MYLTKVNIPNHVLNGTSHLIQQ